MEHINLWAVFLAAVAKFILGGLWYSPLMFANVWLKEVGLVREELVGAARPLLMSAFLGGVTAMTLAIIISLADLNVIKSLALGGLMGTGIMAAMLGPQFAFEGRPFRLYAIYAGQYIVELLLMSAIIGGWR